MSPFAFLLTHALWQVTVGVVDAVVGFASLFLSLIPTIFLGVVLLFLLLLLLPLFLSSIFLLGHPL